MILKLLLNFHHKRKIVTYGGYFEAFMETLKEKEQEKIQYGKETIYPQTGTEERHSEEQGRLQAVTSDEGNGEEAG